MNAPTQFGKARAVDAFAPLPAPAFYISDHSRLGSQGLRGLKSKLAIIDWTPDLGENIGSLNWFRGLGTLSMGMAIAFFFIPDFGPLYGAQPTALNSEDFDEARAQMVMPLAFGSDSGRRMGANEAVVTLTASPERPRIEITAALGSGTNFAGILERAGVSADEATTAAALAGRATVLGDVEPGTPVTIILGKAEKAGARRPLEQVAFRARFDLNLQINRTFSGLQLKQMPIQVTEIPLRIRSTVGSSLYKSARAAGAPAAAIQQYLKTISGHISLTSLTPEDEFDIIMDYQRAETGEGRAGRVLYAGVMRDGKPKLQLLPWTMDGREQWYDASSIGKPIRPAIQRTGMAMPVNGRITSRFGMRRHPILGYQRMHAGIDFGVPTGTPIYAVADGVVTGAGRMGGCGIAVKLSHTNGLSTRFCHMSRMAVGGGQTVRRGQIIGYVGSTGLSTGPHLHYEMYKDGRPINPLSVSMTASTPPPVALPGPDMARFRARLQLLMSIRPGAALGGTQGRKP